jgi:hypothetical protein
LLNDITYPGILQSGPQSIYESRLNLFPRWLSVKVKVAVESGAKAAELKSCAVYRSEEKIHIYSLLP